MKENDTKISMTREELDAVLQDAAKRAVKETMEEMQHGQIPPQETDQKDEEMLRFIETFPPAEDVCGMFSRSLQKMANYVASGKAMNDLQGKIDEFNAFEEKISPYYPYADDPEDCEEPLTGEALTGYMRKHKIYLALQREKLRRFGLFGWYRGTVATLLNGKNQQEEIYTNAN